MSLVASEQQVQSAPAARSKEVEKWEELPVYMHSFERVVNEAVVDVVKMYTRSAKLKNVPIPSISNETAEYKDALTKDPFNLRKMNNLAFRYLHEGQHEMALNVLMRGWKRASEIPDEKIRFRFLMKVCELSYGFWKYKQALAAFRDIVEPEDPKFQKPYLILGTQVWSQNGDLHQGLKFFQRSIDGESIQLATRTLAVTVLDLKKAGAFEAAKSSVENIAGQKDHPDVLMISEFADKVAEENKALIPQKVLQDQRTFIALAVALSFFFFLIVLYWLERRSLAAMDWPSKKST
mmetsp:Transcript_95332/g.199411  ORF Transcript_95332/g.199411 Transcript_95332/m.199411 type:complete len:293 (+) Transcript_95332:72-950(+)|eukprot:CAMPEP_0206470438 /NCGR_PEP_ID=MMETSP0324_2-20121206/30931_1 /ASSEMBLY_ACC=CAM_ASM_000836 /TAXON_ID=2866 /ORGANISM="Crypthecodinium cohnii, Strain Seligo" /LENGTH=292 /DNA_ID=CAMNT_0053944499 /DNA_START=38 /DNA_END=916 /DNA_ORIENTATION=+